jgi:hypothetical protein
LSRALPKAVVSTKRGGLLGSVYCHAFSCKQYCGVIKIATNVRKKNGGNHISSMIYPKIILHCKHDITEIMLQETDLDISYNELGNLKENYVVL